MYGGWTELRYVMKHQLSFLSRSHILDIFGKFLSFLFLSLLVLSSPSLFLLLPPPSCCLRLLLSQPHPRVTPGQCAVSIEPIPGGFKIEKPDSEVLSLSPNSESKVQIFRLRLSQNSHGQPTPPTPPTSTFNHEGVL